MLSRNTFQEALLQRAVSEDSVNAMLRRALVMKCKARFYDAQYMRRRVADPEAQGIFPRYPTLKELLRSVPAIAAFWNRV